MNQVQNIFDSFYTKFVLRDLFGKIIPGFIFLCSIATLFDKPADILALLKTISAWYLIPIFGISWVLAFALQALGESLRLIRYSPKDIKQTEWYQLVKKFGRRVVLDEKQQKERIVIIKEACGNTSVSIIASVLVVIGSGLITFHDIFTLIVIFLIVILLQIMHRKHIKREFDWVNVCIEGSSED
jgi:hypothetical protein